MPIDFARRLAEGLKAKLDFDYACNRGHSFGEYHAHGVVNEILSANVDPATYLVCSGFPHLAIQTPGNAGRKREIDFALQHRETADIELAVEVKWAGSGHCTPDNILTDLCRLHLVKSSSNSTLCLFTLAGAGKDIAALFRQSFLAGGESSLLIHAGENGVTPRKGPRIKAFDLSTNAHHQREIDKAKLSALSRLPALPSMIQTTLKNTASSLANDARFRVLVWTVHV